MVKYGPFPVDGLSTLASRLTSTSAADTEVSPADTVDPALAILTMPTLPFVEDADGLDSVQAPPTSADPQPVEVVRPNASEAMAGATTAIVTEWVTEVLAPPLSVTVRVIVYVPDWV